MDIRKEFHEVLPDLSSYIDRFIELIKQDYIFMNFCQFEHFQNYFYHIREYIDAKPQKLVDVWKYFTMNL